MTIDLLRCALPAAPPPFDIGRVDHHFVVSAALEALGAARGEPDRAGPALSRWFRRARRLGSKDRRLVAEMVYDTLRHEGILTRDGAADDAAKIERWKGLVGGDRMEGLPATTPEADYATALSLPLEIATEWLDVLGEEGAAALGAALSERAPTTLRANRVRCTPQQLAKRLAEEGIETTPTAQATDGLHVLTRANFPALRSFKEGWFEVQDEASQLLCAAIGARRGLSVLDFCAGAGGKSLALAATGADVRAHDVRPRVLQELHKRAKRADVKVSVGPPKPADVVLVDA
ncbi:MAG: 16S rRNA (cytosine967-C5)-methyltransferase, partial [Myxococcota bacterium]